MDIIIIGARFTQVNGHVELHDEHRHSEKSVHDFATEKFELFREGFAYREVNFSNEKESDVPSNKLLNKSVIFSKVYSLSINVSQIISMV